MMRTVVLAALLVGCTSTRYVPLAELAPVGRGPVGEPLVVRSTGIWKSRLDPTSKLRLFNRDGESTRWLRADALHVVDGWIYVPAVVDVLDHTDRIIMEGLTPGVLADLAAARPTDQETTLETDTLAGSAVVVARGKALRVWLAAFLDGVAARTAPGPDVEVCDVDAPMATPGRCYAVHGRERARLYLRRYLNGEPLGTWTLDLGRYGQHVLSASQILVRLESGLATFHGWRWADVAKAQIEDLSGIKTLGGIVGTLGISVLTLAVNGSSVVGGPQLPVSGAFGLPNVGATRRDVATWRGTLADARGLSAPALFSESARRRATGSVVAQAELSFDAFGATQVLEGGSAAIRVGQIVDFGVGGAHLAVRRGAQAGSYGLAFGRFGVHLPIDASHRYAIPLSIDLGGGGGEELGVMVRMRSGLVRRLGERAFVGATVAPMFLNWKHVEQARRWTTNAGLELGVVF